MAKLPLRKSTPPSKHPAKDGRGIPKPAKIPTQTAPTTPTPKKKSE